MTDEVKDIVPEFLMLLQGVIDSPDIPLNVSRSYLQGDPNVKKINNHITKKVADKLEEIFNKERKEFEEKWESLGLFVKYGMMTDDKFFEKAVKFHIMEDVRGGKFYTLDEYRSATEVLQKNKEDQLVILYTTNPVQQDSFIRQAQAKGYVVVKLETMIDAAFISQMEPKWEKVHFTRVDADIADNLIDKAEITASVLSTDEESTLKELFSPPDPGTSHHRGSKRTQPRSAPDHRDPTGVYAPDEGYGGHERRHGQLLCQYARRGHAHGQRQSPDLPGHSQRERPWQTGKARSQFIRSCTLIPGFAKRE